ncbi:DUF3331 domain-containing protein [Burkholderia vietnamiensis]|uniref:DUF3331 domain-containing protein n=1 Tax=Burkholderia vietnamiensis TaxID=60552 RepID=UPI001CF5CF44|nr:DUF3331 domain-containing protein [Burkholderia vietnamiensis]MCA7946883.1 DUF3331 domain-containing protein [Burkholderia vietnamiensis]
MKAPQSMPALDPADVHVEILERSDTLLVVRWVEPGRCHYGEQRWRRRFAQRTGTCALSRQVIQRGDEVFRPAERPAPANAAAMISAAEVLALASNR